MEYSPINFEESFSSLNEYWHPKKLAMMNDYEINIAKLEGEYIWHDHPDTDEAFIVLEGNLDVEFRDGLLSLKQGEMFVIPKGVEHKPVAKPSCKILFLDLKVAEANTVEDTAKPARESSPV